jgi:hypothetical protein
MTKTILILFSILSFLIMRAIAQGKYLSTFTAIAHTTVNIEPNCLSVKNGTFVEIRTSLILKFSLYL